MDDRAAINDQVGARFAKLKDVMTKFDIDLSHARTSLAIALNDMLLEGGGDPSAAEAIDAALSVAVFDYIFALREAVGAFESLVAE